MKPCYIQARPGMQINLDGPALSINVPDRAPVLIPLGRVSRVVISGSAECSITAALACAEHGIAVTFLQQDGTVRAHLFGRYRVKNDLFTHLRNLLDRPDWPDRYQQWLESAASYARKSLCRKLDLPPDRFSINQICGALDSEMEQFINKSQRRYLQRRLHGLCSNLANDVLQRAGLDAKHSRYFEQRLNTPDDFAKLLALSLQLPLLDWLRRQPEQGRIIDSDVISLFERHSRRLEDIARRLTSRLHGFLVDLE